MKREKWSILTFGLWILVLGGCKSGNEPLPYLGTKTEVNGKEQYHTIPAFDYINQDSVHVTNQDMAKYVYITDFFFTSCPSICPKVMKNMFKIHNEFKTNDGVRLLSFTIDPKRDTPAKLKQYSNNLGIDQSKWHFLHGDKDATLDLANAFFVAALEDPEAPGGFDHSGKIILVDKQGHIRSFCDGTDDSSIDQFIADVKKLLSTNGI